MCSRLSIRRWKQINQDSLNLRSRVIVKQSKVTQSNNMPCLVPKTCESTNNTINGTRNYNFLEACSFKNEKTLNFGWLDVCKYGNHNKKQIFWWLNARCYANHDTILAQILKRAYYIAYHRMTNLIGHKYQGQTDPT